MTYSLKPMDPDTSAVLQSYCDLGWLSRSRLPKKELKKIKAAGLPEAANYEYHVEMKHTSKRDTTEDGNKFEKTTELEKAASVVVAVVAAIVRVVVVCKSM